ncbi:hypothetical protein [Streptomyces sp. NPDC052042]
MAATPPVDGFGQKIGLPSLTSEPAATRPDSGSSSLSGRFSLVDLGHV